MPLEASHLDFLGLNFDISEVGTVKNCTHTLHEIESLENAIKPCAQFSEVCLLAACDI